MQTWTASLKLSTISNLVAFLGTITQIEMQFTKYEEYIIEE